MFISFFVTFGIAFVVGGIFGIFVSGGLVQSPVMVGKLLSRWKARCPQCGADTIFIQGREL